MPAEFGYRVIAGDLHAALDAVSRRIDVATVSALKATQNLAKKNIRSKMRGRPRWDQRGKSRVYTTSVNLNLTPHHVSKGGGPGKFTGHLSRAVGGVKKPKKTLGGFKGGVGVGGTRSTTNMYRGKVEGKYPYFKPGVESASKGMEAIWMKSWDKAIRL
jgi:hypothetical protein